MWRRLCNFEGYPTSCYQRYCRDKAYPNQERNYMRNFVFAFATLALITSSVLISAGQQAYAATTCSGTGCGGMLAANTSCSKTPRYSSPTTITSVAPGGWLCREPA